MTLRLAAKVIAGDGQVTLGQSVVMKPNAKKVRRLADGVISGFAGHRIDRLLRPLQRLLRSTVSLRRAGSTADAITLFERLESKIEEHPGEA